MNFSTTKKDKLLVLWKFIFLISLGYVVYYSAENNLKGKAQLFLVTQKKAQLELESKILKNESTKALADSTVSTANGKKNSEGYNNGVKFGKRVGLGTKFMFKSRADKSFYFAIFALIISLNFLVFRLYVRNIKNTENKIIVTLFWLIILCTISFWFIVFSIGTLRFQLSIVKISLLLISIISVLQFCFLLIKNHFFPQVIDENAFPKNIILQKLEGIVYYFKKTTFIKKWGIWFANCVVLFTVILADHFLPSSSTTNDTLFQGSLLTLGGLALVLVFSLIVGSFHYKLIHKNALRNDKGIGSYTLYFLLNFLLYLCLLSLAFYMFKGSTMEKNMDTIPSFIFALALIYSLFTDYKYNKTLQQRLVDQRNRAELSTLKAQVNPHFLFNTLNNLYGTAIVEEADKTAAGIHQLAGIMRHVVEESKHESTPIEKEIKFLGDFIELNKIRLPNQDNIKVSVKVKYDEKSFLIAPLLLIPFVENAFKYGISIKDNCFVDIDLNIVEDKIHFLCRNSIIKNNNLEPSTGTGIDNVRKRLALNYPNRHTLDISDKDGLFEVRLMLDLG